MSSQRVLTTFMIISFAVHLISVLWIIPKLKIQRKEISEFEKTGRIIKLTHLNNSFLNQLRTKGIKNGQKFFTAPVNLPKGDPTSKDKKQDNLSKAKSFAPTGLPKVSNSNPLFSIKPNHTEKTQLEQKRIEFIRRQKIEGEQIKNEIMQKFFGSEALSHGADFDIDFTPPEGIAEDELNDMERKFYSFQKRTYKTYIGAFLRSYYDLTKKFPTLASTLRVSKFDLVGRVTFDINGEILGIKIIKWAPSDMIQELFESTLKNIRRLPNPPEALVEDKKMYSIYFQLKAQ